MPEDTQNEFRLAPSAGKGGRRRVHPTDQARNRAKYEKRKVLQGQARELLLAIIEACERGHCEDLTNHLPEDPKDWLPELTRRFSEVKIVGFRREEW